MGLTWSILTGVVIVHSYSVLGSKKEPWTKRWPFPCSTGYWALKLNGFFKRLSGKTDSSFIQFSRVWFLATLWTAARRASVSITNSRSLLRLMSIESVTPSNHLILCHPLFLLHSIFPRTGSFQMSQLSISGGQSTGVSASTSVLPMNIQASSPLGWTGWISLQSKGLSRVFSNTVQKHQFFGAQLSLQSLTSIHDYWKNHSLD